jgi:hypothetical protein
MTAIMFRKDYTTSKAALSAKRQNEQASVISGTTLGKALAFSADGCTTIIAC